MPVYSYEGVMYGGQRTSGVVEAFDEFEAVEKARVTCRVVTGVRQVRQKPAILQKELGSGRVKPAAVAIMCQQFATVIGSGMAVSKCVSLVAGQTADKGLKKILEEVAEDVASGHGLAVSFESKGGEKLPAILYETVRAGEASGSLDESFLTLSQYFSKRSQTRAKLVQTLTYPVFVLVIAAVVVAVMMAFVIPTFRDLLAGYGGKMPALTQSLIAGSDFVGTHAVWILAVVTATVLGLKVWTKTDRGRDRWSRFKLSLPVLGPIVQSSNAAQFANTLALLLGSGLPMTHAVSVTARVVENPLIAREVGEMTVGLESGKSLGACLEGVPELPRPLVDMAYVGEESGTLEQTLATMGAYYDEETERATDRAVSRLEPCVLVFIAAFAGYIVLALYLAMFSIYGSM